MLDGGARGTWSSARSSGEHRHRAGMKKGEEGAAAGVGSPSLLRKNRGRRSK
jgi:hypothetical protein